MIAVLSFSYRTQTYTTKRDTMDIFRFRYRETRRALVKAYYCDNIVVGREKTNTRVAYGLRRSAKFRRYRISGRRHVSNTTGARLLLNVCVVKDGRNPKRILLSAKNNLRPVYSIGRVDGPARRTRATLCVAACLTRIRGGAENERYSELGKNIH